MDRQPRGFTLIEVLVVIAIVGLLIALLLPAVQAARESARRSQCRSNLKQIGLAMQNYHAAQRSLPPGNIHRTAGICPGMVEPTGSFSTRYGNWAIALLPYLEQASLFGQYQPAYLNESPQNRAFRETRLPVFLCPSDINPDECAIPATGPAAQVGAKYAPGSYRAVSGRSADGMNFLDSEMMYSFVRKDRGPIHIVGVWGYHAEKFDAIHDGLSNTLLVGESTTRTSPGYRTFWAYSFGYYTMSGASDQPRTLWGDFDRCVTAGGQGNDLPCKRAWGGTHSAGINFVLCDGSVHLINKSIDMDLFGGLATIAGGELAPLPPE